MRKRNRNVRISSPQPNERGIPKRRRRRGTRTTKVFIDTVTLTAQLDPSELEEIVSKAESSDECYRIHTRSNGYRRNYNIRLDSETRDSLLVQLDRGDGTGFRCQFHPGHGNLWFATNWLEELLPLGYLDLLSRCFFTRVDWTVDIINKGIEDLVLWHPSMKTNRIFAGQKGLKEVQSVYTGSRRSKRHFLMYDRVTHLNKLNHDLRTKFEVPSRKSTRLEFRNQRVQTFRELRSETSNPFQDVRLFDLKGKQVSNTPLRLLFDSFQFRGCNASLALMEPDERREYVAMIPESIDATWWDAESVWSSWSDCVDALSPSEDSLIGISNFLDDAVEADTA